MATSSPVELMRAVRRLFPQPQVFCAFHTRSLGGLWVAPAPAAQIVTTCPAFSVNFGGKR